MKTPRITIQVAALLLAFSILPNISFAQSGSDKLDVKALEQKYWSAKDDDFSVVQNRAFSKAKRFYGTAHYGQAINDPYFSGSYFGLSGGYFFSESFGVEGSYQSTSFDKNKIFNDVIGLGGGPKANNAKSKMVVNALWVPIYAKMSLFDRKIIHFDMGFTAGLGQFAYESIYNIGTTANPIEKTRSANTTGYSIGIMQQFYFNRLAAIRVDFNNTVSTQDTVKYNDAAGAKSGSKSINDTSLIIGLTVFSWWGEHAK